MKIGTVTTGAGIKTIITINYCPQYLFYVTPDQFTNIKVNVAGDGVILDLDATELTALSTMRRMGMPGNGYVIPLSDGLVPNKVTTITIENSGANTVDLYGYSMARGTTYLVSSSTLILQDSKENIRDFAYLGITAPNADDIFDVEFLAEDGDITVETFEFPEIQAVLGMYTNLVNVYAFDNLQQNITTIQVRPKNSNRLVFVTRYVPIGTVIQS